MDKFCNNLKYLRKSRSITQQELADVLGISRQGYAKYENDLGEPDISTLIKLADYFDVTVDSLIGRTSNDDILNTVKLSDFYKELYQSDNESIDKIITIWNVIKK